MSEKKDRLIHLIMNENVSAIATLVDELLMTSDEVIELIKSLLETGELNGTLTDDEQRFFRINVKISEAPSIEREDAPPSFLSFNTRPPMVLAIIGLIITIGGLVANIFAGNFTEQSIASILIFVGLIIMICGLFSISQRKTPS